jgi:hypothetical protein
LQHLRVIYSAFWYVNNNIPKTKKDLPFVNNNAMNMLINISMYNEDSALRVLNVHLLTRTCKAAALLTHVTLKKGHYVYDTLSSTFEINSSQLEQLISLLSYKYELEPVCIQQLLFYFCTSKNKSVFDYYLPRQYLYHVVEDTNKPYASRFSVNEITHNGNI